MTIFRYKKDGQLYKIYKVLRSHMCSWKTYQAIPFYHSGKHITMNNLKNFEVVAYN